MNRLQSNTILKGCLFVLVILGLLSKFTTASSSGSLQTGDWIPEQTLSASQRAFRDDIRRELAELSDAEDRILSKMQALAAERDTIQAKKRGHTQCFLNLVSCFRKRK
ncbi:hypothetical protein ACF0H5_019797 [Mactra antiquata]